MPESVARALFKTLSGPLALGFDADGQPYLGLVSLKNDEVEITVFAQLLLMGPAIEE